MPLESFHNAATAAKGTLNDAFLASVIGGVRKYHERHDVALDRLRVTLSISLRTPEDPLGGNRITLQRFELAANELDVKARMRAVHAACRRARDEPAVQHTDAIAATLNLLPTRVIGSMLKHVDVVASNVPGFTFRVYLAGAEVLAQYAFGPTIGAALNVTLLSYQNTCHLGISIDTNAAPDPEVLVECLREGFDEVFEATRTSTSS
ncbi:MAG: WS/DGAT domain-containing protein [Acidimicrobiales bacterium]